MTEETANLKNLVWILWSNWNVIKNRVYASKKGVELQVGESILTQREATKSPDLRAGADVEAQVERAFDP